MEELSGISYNKLQRENGIELGGLKGAVKSEKGVNR